MDAAAFDAKRFVRPASRTIAFYFLAIVIPLMAMVKPSHAAGTVALLPSSWSVPNTPMYMGGYLTPQAACDAYAASYSPGGACIIFASFPYSNYTVYQFRAYSSAGNYVAIGQSWPLGAAVCPANSTGTTTCTCTDPYVPDTTGASCVLPACPAHTSGTPCACGAGYQFDAAGTSCVPVVACPVSDLPDVADPEILPFENNPDLSDTARLTPRMQTALQCLLTAASAGSPSVGSAYRPPAYNQHLIDMWRKWQELTKGKDSANPACADRKAKIHGHFQQHKLLESQPPVPGSLHTLGEAVDMTISLPPANIDALAAGCQLRRPKPVKDRVHFIHQ